jgi:hypothetical protein
VPAVLHAVDDAVHPRTYPVARVAVSAAAAIIVQVVLYANDLNAMAVGSIQIDWSNGKASLRISKSFEPVGFEVCSDRLPASSHVNMLRSSVAT